jgi:hypothetical protein
MSDPMTNIEIEDVLSSIRRLVSEDHRPAPRMNLEPPPAAPKLVLTPALRVVPDVPDEGEGDDAPPEEAAEDADRLPWPDASSAVAPASHGEAAAVLETRLAANPQEWEPDGSEVAANAPEWVVEWDVEDIAGSPLATATGEETSPDEPLPEVAFVAHDRSVSLLKPTPAEPAAPPAALVPDPQAEPPFVANPSARQADVDLPVVPQDWQDEALAPDVSAPNYAGIDSADFAPDDDVAPEKDLAPGAAWIGDADLIPEDDAPPAVEVADEDILSPGDDRSRDDDLVDETLIDEEALRDLVREMIREELQGALGERITRNVRKLVRAEIHRVLTTNDFD